MEEYYNIKVCITISVIAFGTVIWPVLILPNLFFKNLRKMCFLDACLVIENRSFLHFPFKLRYIYFQQKPTQISNEKVIFFMLWYSFKWIPQLCNTPSLLATYCVLQRNKISQSARLKVDER